ncbi:PKD domain-containing protein, partial [Candidatus Peregrinibacteria bacterium]|nr:PKD domain-containing protein [Candidatus Peregrinibacteria bacterium]
MSLLSKPKNLILTLLVSALCASFFSTTASAYSWREFGDDLFGSGDEEGISLTEYTGELAQLQTDGFDKSLVASTDLREFIIKIVNYALGFLALLAVLIVIYGGVLYLTAAGEEEKTTTGKKAIFYAVIGLIIVMGSFALVNTVIDSGTGGQNTTGISSSGGEFAGGGFNASAEQVRALAIEIINGYQFLTEATEDLKNIQNDVEKESLLPDARPSKGAVLTYLNSVKIKIKNIQTKLQPFTVADARINDAIRELDKDIDRINKLSGKELYDPDDFEGGKEPTECSPNNQGGFWDGVQGKSDEEICKDNGFTAVYTPGLYSAWYKMYKEYSGEDPYKDIDGGNIFSSGENLYDGIVKPLAADYTTDLKRIFRLLDDINDKYQNIDAIKEGQAASAYAFMKADTAYGYSVTKKDNFDDPDPEHNVNVVGISFKEVLSLSEGFLKSIEDWTITSSPDQVGQLLIAGLEQQSYIYEALKNLKFVKARLSADVVEGAAPLTVIFDTVGSADPAGGSIKGSNIVWDIGGTLTIDDLYAKDTGQKTIEKHPDVNCENTITDNSDDAEFVGNTALRCEFTKPGTYTAAVKIRSNQPTKYAEGISVLTINVKPRTTKIELSVSAGETISVSHYNNEVLVEDKQRVRVNLGSANAGVIFDACATSAATGNATILYKWDYGNGETTEFGETCKNEEGIKYTEPGNYRVILEVINPLGVIDKKAFTLEIASIAARIKAKPSNGSFVNTPVTFDASASKSDLGKITNYEWTITRSAQQDIPFIDQEILEKIDQIYPPGEGYKESGSNLKTITHEFKYGLNYDVTVKISDESQETDSATIENYRIESQSPKAFFDFEIPNEAQPGTVNFDGSKSFDPDGDGNFSYEWTIEPADNNWEIVKEENGLNQAKPIIRFLKKGEYDVTLKVKDNLRPEEFNEKKQTITIDNVLDVSWAQDQKVTAKLNEEGKATIEFNLVNNSGTAIAYEIDYGDGNTEQGEFPSTISHEYTEAGKFNAKVTLYDEEDIGNTAVRGIFIGGGDKPVAKIGLSINGEEVDDLSKPVMVNKKDILTFDASDSQNSDGTGRDLKYSWNFGDTKTSSQKSATHSYKDLSPVDPGYFTVTLKVSDQDDVTKFDEHEIQVQVLNQPPRFSSVQGLPLADSADLITPVNVQLKAFGLEDPDGEIVSYRWWYFDIDDPDEQLGVTVTQANKAQLQIGTNGKEGQELEYGFGLEVTDSDGEKYSNEEEISDGQYSTVEVVNGKNAKPTAKFNVDTTSVFVGDKVNFTSSSSDPDGSIKFYIWDTEGDGFFNNEPSDQSSIEHVYEAKNKTGYPVRLKVIDDKGGEAVSEPIKIYVDSLAKPPLAAFKYSVVPDSEGMKIQFSNNSKPDEAAGADIISYKWDFDTKSLNEDSDSDGDGLKNNDIDSQAKDPNRLYTKLGSYDVKLTVTDDQGNSDEVVNTITIPLANPPVAAFTYQVVDNKVSFTNNSSADGDNDASIKQYIWDFDTASSLSNADSDGDGSKDNDSDSTEKNPVYQFGLAGTYQVKLTVKDNQGNEDSVTNEVNATAGTTDLGGGITQPLIPDGDQTGGQEGGGGTTDSGGAAAGLKAFMSTIPVPNAENIVYLPGESGAVKFDFSKSEGAISYYTIDKNIYFDTNGNG